MVAGLGSRYEGRSVLKVLSSVRTRLFLMCWVVFTVHFATNVVREHYPAYSLIEDFSFKVDKYLPFHPDIFKHTDGHSYIGNNVAGCVVAAVPLAVFWPVLSAIESYEKDKLAKSGPPDTTYRTTHKNSAQFLRLAKEQGLSLRFGASTVVTSAFLMAPLTALCVVLMFMILMQRGLSQRKSLGLSLIFAFATPTFFRAGVLNHNMMTMWVTFLAFYMVWIRPPELPPPPVKARAWAGALCGFALALDYSGVIPLLAFFAYVIGVRIKAVGLRNAIMESVPFVLGSVPPVIFLLFTQWAMFENPWLPGQVWMPDSHETTGGTGVFTNPYSTEGFRGFTIPTPDLFFLNLFDPSYGMFSYGPLLALALIPMRWYRNKSFILPKAERIFVLGYFLAFLTFCSANQYSRIQFNSGFRYMVPLVPLMFLASVDHLLRMPPLLRRVVVAACLLNSWVIAMVREPLPESWGRILSDGPQLPWTHVLSATLPEGHILGGVWLPVGVMLITAAAVFGIWKLGPAPSDDAPATG